MSGSAHVGVDTGGTFTDLVTDDGEVRKAPSTPADPADAVRAVCEPFAPDVLAHGTTVATNAMLQRKLGRVALVATRGFADVIEIARQARPSLYDARVDRPRPLVPRELRFEVSGRLDAAGRELEAFDGAVAALDRWAVSTRLRFACCMPTSTRVMNARSPTCCACGAEVVCSHEVSPEFREYERLVTTVADAALRPVCRAYLQRVAALARRHVLVMTSAGGLVPLADAADHPARVLLSGPAGGVRPRPRWRKRAASATQWRSTWAARAPTCAWYGAASRRRQPRSGSRACRCASPRWRCTLSVPAVVPSPGSTRWRAVVGPESAGRAARARQLRARRTRRHRDRRQPRARAAPGGHRASRASAGSTSVRRGVALARAGVTADGVVAVVDAAMERVVRVVTVEQGIDPRDLTLVAFGGAGPLHACAVAERLGMRTVLVPARAGVFSAVGLLISPEQREIVRTWPTPGSTGGLADARAALAAEAGTLLAGGEIESWVDCRYAV